MITTMPPIPSLHINPIHREERRLIRKSRTTMTHCTYLLTIIHNQLSLSSNKEEGAKREGVGCAVLSTVFGNIHNTGGMIVCTLLIVDGFEVIDLGVI